MTWEKFWSIIDRVRAQADMQDEASVKQFLYTELINLPQDEPSGHLGAAAVGALSVVDITQRPEQDAFVGTVKFNFTFRSEERRVGKECLRLCRSRWSPYH